MNCSALAYMGGLCELHYRAEANKDPLRDAAIRALNEEPCVALAASPQAAVAELTRLQEWWRRACRAVEFGYIDPLLQDEAAFAMDWCIQCARELVRQERSRFALDIHRRPVKHFAWQRFAQLERGNRSSGVARKVVTFPKARSLKLGDLAVPVPPGIRLVKHKTQSGVHVAKVIGAQGWILGRIRLTPNGSVRWSVEARHDPRASGAGQSHLFHAVAMNVMILARAHEAELAR